MRGATLVRRSLAWYWRTNLAVVLGVATAVAALGGALLTGESVRSSLRGLVLARLGNTDSVVSASGFFREALAAGLARSGAAACPLVALDGLVIHQESGRRASGVQVYGIDERFWRFHRRSAPPPEPRDVFLSEALARELGGGAGDSILVRVEKPSAIPPEWLHGARNDAARTIRFTARQVLGSAQFGEFSLRPQQGPVRAAFVALDRLQRELGLHGRVNTVLVSSGRIDDALRREASLEDFGVRLRGLGERGLALESERGLLPGALVDAAQAAAAKLGIEALPVLTYLANTIRVDGRELPYSLVSAVELERFGLAGRVPADAIVLNEWAARELAVRPGDAVSLEYYVWQENGALAVRSVQFRVAAVVRLAGAAADRDLTPDYPGITDSDSLRDWDPPFPIDLGRIRRRDEDYWEKYRATPKAFLPLEAGQRLWESRFGRVTSLRLQPASALEPFRAELRAALDPFQMGFTVYPARRLGLEASRGATDFGEYFTYFSFFLVLSALLLAGLFFRLGIEQRLREIGLLRAVGYTDGRIRRLFLAEALVLAGIGTALGVAGALLYGALMVHGLRTWWIGAAGTQALALEVSARALAMGAVGGLLSAVAFISLTLRGVRNVTPRGLLSGAAAPDGRGASRMRAAALASVSLALALLAAAVAGALGQTAAFFAAGGLLLAAALLFGWLRLSAGGKLLVPGGLAGLVRLGFRNAGYRPGRSVLSIALIASATFLIAATEAFRREGETAASDRRSGTGGFPLIAESMLPIYHDLNTGSGRVALNLSDEESASLQAVEFVALRLRPGDDASCLNLYQPRNPRVLGAPAALIASGRFSFQDLLARTAEEKANPWRLLEAEPADGVVPAIADATSLAYVLHKKLGEEIVLPGARPVRLRLVAALRDSVLQSELIIAEKHFVRLFPDHQGYRVFFIDAPVRRTGEVTAALEQALGDYGFDVVPAAERLAAFHRVENTYLSTFQMLGGLGLLLGTVGLAAVLLRNVLERRRELALLQAVGWRPGHLALTVVAENALLLGAGLITGVVCAALAVAPALLSRGGPLPVVSLGRLLLGVALTGLIASLAALLAVLRSPLLAALRSE